MPLVDVGKSGVKFREASRTALSERAISARDSFPELEDFDWPERGSAAELDSLLFQATRFKATPEPDNIREAVEQLVKEYPRAPQRNCFKGDWDSAAVKAKIEKIAKTEVKRDSSPGVPFACLGITNGSVIDNHMQLVVESVYARLELLSKVELSDELTAVDLVQLGLCDPVRLFVKQEPHPKRKIETRRFRLISSVSLVDQLVERLLFGYQNQLEIAMWKTCPSKPGMGLSEGSQADAIWEQVAYKHTTCPAVEADISGFDWSVQEWELRADVEMRIFLGGFHEKVARAARNRFKCLSLSVFQLSNGTLIAQAIPGLMKSGSYCTSSSNSRIRCLMAKLIGSPWCIAMGDDSVEGYVPGAQEAYRKLGHDCKDYQLCEASYQKTGTKLISFNFCSHYLSKRKFYLTSWPKTFLRYLDSENPQYLNLFAELQSSPIWPKIQRYIRRKNLASDKIFIEEDDEEEANEVQQWKRAATATSYPAHSAAQWSGIGIRC